jgi:hypothetical protein
MIRQGKCEDVRAMAAIIEARYRASLYADLGEMDVAAAKRLLTSLVFSQSKQGAEGTLVMVAERDGEITAFIVGYLDPVYHIGPALSATDLFFVARPGADLRDIKSLADAFSAWATANPKVVEMQMGVVDTFGTDLKLADRLYRGLGLERCGAIYRRSIER